ncbi:MAG: metallophosphoesterase [Bacilli bacterium]|nr:metallophosphoesterase [Bacilli bacterium]
MKIFVTADTHFNHENIIKYCNRPFKDVNEMNEVIINNWNSVVSKDDIIYHIGDYGFGTKDELKEIFDKLNGKKYLIMGNHDLRVGKRYFLELGFIEVYKKKCEFDKYIFTHRPIEVNENIINVYGHIHNNPIDEKYNDKNHMCVSLDKTKFKPVLLTTIEDNKL